MAKLIVKQHGTELIRLELQPGQEYIAGRSADSQIPLPQQKGLSRQHLKFYYKDDHWVVECLSKFLLLQSGNDTCEVLELKSTTSFSFSVFEFQFETEAPAPVAEELQEAPELSEPKPHFSQVPVPISQSEVTSPRANNEATVAGVSSLVPFLRISSGNSSEDETLRLEGHLWIAGRDSNSEIFLETPHASRKHFELIRTPEGFFVTDLGSSNGTKLNGNKLPPHEPVKVESGDSISVQNIKMLFEVRDVQFMDRVNNLPVVQDPYAQPMPMMPWPEQQMYYLPPTPEEKPEFTGWKKHLNWKQHKVRMLLVGALPILLILLFSDDKPKNPTAPRDPAAAAGQPQTPANVPFEQMTNEQKNAIKDSFNLARNLYVQGKYELCITEVAKLHLLIPFFENSKELEEFCKQGRELVIRQKDLERKERERAIIEQNIRVIVESCDAKLKGTTSVEEARRCLIEAIELDPEHPSITRSLAAVQQREENKKLEEAEQRSVSEKAAKGEQHFRKADQLYKSGRLYKAQLEFQKFLGTPYPRSERLKSMAKQAIDSIKDQLKVKVSSYLDQCRTLGEKGRFKEAYLACDKAVDEDPGNETAKSMRNTMLSSLRSEIKSVYEDSVLEESMGNVDAAKEKWNKIIKENLDFDDYTHKAKGKLQKYGVGI